MINVARITRRTPSGLIVNDGPIVVPPAGLFDPGRGPNFPVGDGRTYTVVGSTTWGEVDPTNQLQPVNSPGDWYYQDGFISGATSGVVLDAIAGRNVGEIVFPAGSSPGGKGPPRTGPLAGLTGTPAYEGKTVYVRKVQRILQPYDKNPTGVQKSEYLTADRAGTPEINFIWAWNNPWYGPTPRADLTMSIAMQGGGFNPELDQSPLYPDSFAYAGVNVPGVDPAYPSLADAQWHEAELYAHMGTAGGADGWFKCFFDGVLTHDYQNLTFWTSGSPAGGVLRFIRWEPIHGGGADTLTVDNVYRTAVMHIEVSST